MTYRSRWALGLAFASAALAGACSSSSNPTGGTSDDSGSPPPMGDGGGPPMEMEAAICEAASLAAPADAALANCFACVAAMCAAEQTACSTDCMCAPAWQCVEQMSTQGNIDTGFSQCQSAVAALSNGDQAAMNINACVNNMCRAQCFGDGG